MKLKLKNISKLVGIITFALLTSCSKDEFVHGNLKTDSKNDVSFEQFKNETGLNQFKNNIKIVQNKNNTTNKNADGSYELSDFDIDTNIIKKLVVNQKSSYTFVIHPKVIVSNSIFNLTMFYKNGWQTLILELEPTAQNYTAIKNGITNEFVGSMKRVFQSNVSASSTSRCSVITVETTHCTCIGNVCDQCSQCVSYNSYTFCDDGVKAITSEGYGGAAPTGNTGSSGGSGPTGNNTTAIENQVDIIPNLEGVGMVDANGNSSNFSVNQIAFNSFVNSLPVYQFNLVTQQTPEFRQSLLDYFASQQGSEASKLFIKQVIDRMIQNPGLNIDIEKSSKSPFFVDLTAVSDGSTQEKVKFNAIYEALTNSPKFKELFLSVFGGNQTMANIKFQIGQTLSNANGSTQITSINPLNNTITINPTYIASSNNILIAKTIIHECIHAFLNYKIFNNNSGMSIPMLNNFDVTNCINQFYNSFNGSQDQHNFIYNFMLPTFQTILSEIKDNLISPQVNLQMQNVTMHFPLPTSPSTQWNWNDFYSNLPLAGLEDCQTFQNEIGTIDNNGNVITTINSVKMNTFLTYFYFGQIYLQP